MSRALADEFEAQDSNMEPRRGRRKEEATVDSEAEPIVDQSADAPDEDDLEARRLIRQIQKGNQHAFSELVSRYQRQVAALAYKMVANYDEAADVTQTVFVKVYNNIWRYDDSKKFYSWLYRITANAAIDYMRKHKRHRHEPLDDFGEFIKSVKADPEATFRRGQLNDFVKKAADGLSEKQRSAFILRDVEGCAIDEVALTMNVSEATVRWYLHRARTRIRKELRSRCPQALSFLGLY